MYLRCSQLPWYNELRSLIDRERERERDGIDVLVDCCTLYVVLHVVLLVHPYFGQSFFKK